MTGPGAIYGGSNVVIQRDHHGCERIDRHFLSTNSVSLFSHEFNRKLQNYPVFFPIFLSLLITMVQSINLVPFTVTLLTRR
jgi:hypothetical protein